MHTDIEDLLRHDDWLRSLVRGLVGDAHVDDVLQRTWMAAWEGGPERPSAWRSWLARVAVNFARSHRRAESRRRHKEASAATPAAAMLPSTEETVARLTALRAVTAACMELPEPYRTAVLLYYYHEIPVREIAAQTGATPGNVRQRLHRGLDLMRHKLGDEYGPDLRAAPGLVALALPRGALPTAGPIVVTPPGHPMVAQTLAPAEAATLTALGAVIMKQKLILVGVIAAFGSIAILWNEFSDPVDPSFGPGGAPVQIASRKGPATPLAAGGAAGERRVVQPPKTPVPVAGPSEPWRALRGAVLDAQGRPVAGVRIGTDADEGIQRALRVVGMPPGQFIAAAESGIDGTFAFTRPPTGPELTVDPRYFNVRSSVLDQRHAEAVDATPVGLLLVVAPAVTVRGIVVGGDGRPLEGVGVEPGIAALTEFPLPLDTTRKHPLRASITPADGSFAVGPCPARLTKIVFSKAGFVAVIHEPGEQSGADLRLTMRRAQPGSRVLAGVVSDPNGRAVAGSRVGMGGRGAVTNESGAYRLEFQSGDEVGEHPHLYAAKAGFQTCVEPDVWDRLRNFEATAERPCLVVDLQFPGQSLSIAGKVVSSGGWPKSGIQIVLWGEPMVAHNQTAPDLALVGVAQESNLGRAGLRASATTSLFGKFELPGLSAQKYRLHLFDASTCYTHTTEPIAAGTAELVIKFPARLYREPVTGRVVTRSGEPVRDSRIGLSGCVYRYGDSTSWSGHTAGRTDAEGGFKLAKIPVSEVQLSFGGSGYIDNSITLLPADLGTNLVVTVAEVCHFRVDVSAARPVPASFRVLDHAGEALMISERSPGQTSASDSWQLLGGKSKVLSTSDHAVTLVLFDADNRETGRLPVRLTPKTVTTLSR